MDADAASDTNDASAAEEMAARAASFGSVAAEYAEFRPGYPDAAVEWLVGHAPAQVLELGAGTGKLTERLVAMGHDVTATDPSEQMLDLLSKAVPRARCATSSAEDLPMANASFDVVVAAQAFHWFDLERALPEIARVLRPGGVLAVVWNRADQKVPWVRKVFTLIGWGGDDADHDPVADSDLFTPSASRLVRHWQSMDRRSLLGFCSSQSAVATMSESRRREVLDQVGAIYDSYGRGPDGMLLPWNTYCYRAKVLAQTQGRGGSGDRLTDPPVDHPLDPFHPGPPGQPGEPAHSPGAGQSGNLRSGAQSRSNDDPVDEDDLDDGLLVDFR